MEVLELSLQNIYIFEEGLSKTTAFSTLFNTPCNLDFIFYDNKTLLTVELNVTYEMAWFRAESHNPSIF